VLQAIDSLAVYAARNIPAVGPYLALGTEAIGIVSGAYAGAKNGWGDGGFW